MVSGQVHKYRILGCTEEKSNLPVEELGYDQIHPNMLLILSKNKNIPSDERIKMEKIIEMAHLVGLDKIEESPGTKRTYKIPVNKVLNP